MSFVLENAGLGWYKLRYNGVVVTGVMLLSKNEIMELKAALISGGF